MSINSLIIKCYRIYANREVYVLKFIDGKHVCKAYGTCYLTDELGTYESCIEVSIIDLSANMADKLVDIVTSDLPILRDYYKTDWPKHNIGYGVLDTYIRWLDQDPNIPHLRICSLNGDWSDGTFIVMDWNVIFCNTLNTDFSRLEKALCLVDYSRRPVISSVDSKLFDFMQKFVTSKSMDYFSTETKWYWLPKNEAAKLIVNIPDGFTLRPLAETDILTANELWPFKYPGSITFLKRLARYNVNYGVFTTDGELAAWCFRLPAGGLGTLQVADAHKRKGLGTLMVKAMAKAISDTGYDVFAPIVWNNHPSLDMFSKIGFTEINRMYWFPPRVNAHWDD